MNLLEQIKQKALQAKSVISKIANPQEPMKFPTTSQALSKSTEIATREKALGYYNQQGGIFNNPLAGELQNKVGMSRLDTQTDAYNQAPKQLKALAGNSPGLFNADFTGSMAVSKGLKKPAQQVSKNIFQGFKDLSTKLLEDLKGKSIVDKKFIEQRLVSSDLNLKQVEKNLILSKLDNYPDKIDVKDFAENIKTDLLPLEIKKSDTYKPGEQNWHKPESMIEEGGFTPKYESVSLPEDIRGNVSKYTEHIYESPIKTSAGNVHWQYQSDKYFGHTRIEDMADGITRRVIEDQSDLYQKGNFEKETELMSSDVVSALNSPDAYKRIKGKVYKNLEEEFQQVVNDDSLGLKYLVEKYGKDVVEDKLNGIRGADINTPKLLDKALDWIEKQGKGNKLAQYNDPTAHFRMVREEVKQAAIDGKTKLQFPTGETAMKIEGLGDRTQWYENVARDGDYNIDLTRSKLLTNDSLKVGKEINQSGNQSWIITDVLGDGKFKAVPKEAALEHMDDMGAKSLNEAIKDISSGNFRDVESFDISGKVDTNNPIYRFYEKDLGKYLKSKYNAKEITDKQGVKWYELDVNPELKNKPVEAFAKFAAPVGGVSAAANEYARKQLEKKYPNQPNSPYLQEESNKIQDSSFLNTPVDKVVNTLKCAESFCGNEEAFKNYIAKKAPWRLDLEDAEDKYGNAGKFGWVVGFTVGTRDDIEKMAKEGDIRYQKLLKKLNFDTEENAIKSALEYWKFRNTAHDKSGKPIGNKYEDIEEAYVNIYNASDVASGDRAKARENWKTHFNK